MATDRFGAFLGGVPQATRRALEELRRRLGLVEDVVAAAPGEPNGFSDRTRCVLSWDNSTRTVTLTPNPSYSIWSDGKRFDFGSVLTFTIPDTEGEHLIYFDETGRLASVTTFDIFIITRFCFVAYVRWDATNKVAVPGLINEQHGSSMSSTTHEYLHTTRGAVYESGMQPTVVVADGNGASDDHARFSVAAGVFRDEDIEHDALAKASTVSIIKLYRSGVNGDWRMSTTGDYPVIVDTSVNRAYYNEWTGALGGWQLTAVGQANFLLAHVFAVPGVNASAGYYVVVVGQNEYSTIAEARGGAAVEINDLELGGLPSPEFRPVCTLILQTSSTYTNTAKSRIRTTDSGDDYIDWRATEFSGSGGSSVSAVWGDISGNIVDQADLQAAFTSLVQYNLFIPTLGGMNQGTGGAAQNSARYVFHGGPNAGDRGILAVQGFIKFGTTGRTFPTSPVTASLPSGFNVVYVGTNPASPIGQAWYGDGVSNTRYGLLQISSPTAVQFFYYGIIGSVLQAVSPTTPSSPITWQTGSDIAYAYTIQAVRV